MNNEYTEWEEELDEIDEQVTDLDQELHLFCNTCAPNGVHYTPASTFECYYVFAKEVHISVN